MFLFSLFRVGIEYKGACCVGFILKNCYESRKLSVHGLMFASGRLYLISIISFPSLPSLIGICPVYYTSSYFFNGFQHSANSVLAGYTGMQEWFMYMVVFKVLLLFYFLCVSFYSPWKSCCCCVVCFQFSFHSINVIFQAFLGNQSFLITFDIFPGISSWTYLNPLPQYVWVFCYSALVSLFSPAFSSCICMWFHMK